MAIDVADWLRGLGLEQYARAFRDSDIDESVLSHLTADDLIGVGVASIGHRRKLLAAIAALKSEPALTIPPPAGKAAAAPAERRQLTVMFCDLVGSTAISSGLDPEDFGKILGAFQKACTDAVQKFGGSVAKFMGDGVLVYFGYPVTHEDDAERAVRASLALIEATASIEVRKDAGGVRVHGYIAPLAEQGPSRGPQNIFINRRVVKDRTIAHAIVDGCQADKEREHASRGW